MLFYAEHERITFLSTAPILRIEQRSGKGRSQLVAGGLVMPLYLTRFTFSSGMHQTQPKLGSLGTDAPCTALQHQEFQVSNDVHPTPQRGCSAHVTPQSLTLQTFPAVPSKELPQAQSVPTNNHTAVIKLQPSCGHQDKPPQVQGRIKNIFSSYFLSFD